jgi:hypothetical protein
MHRTVIALLLLLTALTAVADDAAECRAGAGTFLTGVVVDAPRFTHGRFRKGVELSHTHLRVLSDRDGKLYDVAIDNLFSTGYDAKTPGIPPALRTIRHQDRVAVCGAPFSRGSGMHWVHPTCGHRPDPEHPNGFLKRIGPDGKPSPNLEANTNFCPLFSTGFFTP